MSNPIINFKYSEIICSSMQSAFENYPIKFGKALDNDCRNFQNNGLILERDKI